MGAVPVTPLCAWLSNAALGHTEQAAQDAEPKRSRRMSTISKAGETYRTVVQSAGSSGGGDGTAALMIVSARAESTA